MQTDQHVFSGLAACTAAMVTTLLVWSDLWFILADISGMSSNVLEYLDPFRAKNSSEVFSSLSSVFIHVQNAAPWASCKIDSLIVGDENNTTLSGSPVLHSLFFVGWAISRCLSTTPHPIEGQGGSILLVH